MDTPIEMLFDLFTSNEEYKKDEDFQQLIKSESKIVWYPNSYTDVQDLDSYYFENSFGFKPNLFIHNDYLVSDLEEVHNRILREIANTENLEVISFYDLGISERMELDEQILNGGDFDWTNAIPPRKFYRSDFEIKDSFVPPLDITQDLLGKAKLYKIKKGDRYIWLLFIVSETFTFFTKVLCEFRFQVDCLFKVREGVGLGGGIVNKSISNLFPFLSCINTNYLVSDIQIRPNYELLNQLSNKLNHSNYSLFKHKEELGELSELETHSYEQTNATTDSLENFFQAFRNE